MHLVYIDDSQDNPYYVFSALAVPSQSWLDIFQKIKNWRRSLNISDDIYVRKEFHAWKFVAGKGKISKTKIIPKAKRCDIYKESLQFLNSIKDIKLFNVCLQSKQEWAFERLLNRINRTLQEWGSYAVLFCDEGKNDYYTRLVRRISVYNPIPSRFGVWQDTGELSRNIPIDRILEDPIFKDSKKSYFIQLADFCAWALMRKEKPVASKTKYGLDKAFNLLKDICVKEANPNDPLGIIR